MEIAHEFLAYIKLLYARYSTLRHVALAAIGHSKDAVHLFVKTVKGAWGQDGACVTSWIS